MRSRNQLNQVVAKQEPSRNQLNPAPAEAVGNLATAERRRLRHQCHTVKIDGPSLRDPKG